MHPQASIIITSFQRSHLLKWNLYSLSIQKIPYAVEIIVLNDGIPDDTEAICNEYKTQLNIKYVFTGHRNLDGDIKWRVPGFAYNIGAKISKGNILILSCAEMFHINDTINYLIEPLIENKNLLSIPVGRDDRDGSFLRYVEANHGNICQFSEFSKYTFLNTNNPFLMAVSREAFFNIGGYDEDFTGIAWDDNDLVFRLKRYGCQYKKTEAQTIHLYHSRYVHGRGGSPEFQHNENLYRSRVKQIVRNQGREWGVFKD